MATIDSIKEILEKNLSIDPEVVTEDSTLDSLDIDSLDLVELICDLEDAEGIDFGEPEGLQTVGDIVAHIDSLK
ncbi:MAG: phosphopantetheine-binding protein [Coriobacteriales bacterium]|nr:acyl carrier protein [Coriobacteriales bacterium]MDD6738994.1 phosphopantetheine-binding protein [Coriobacteriaceae bacterium]MDD6768776.1 phosphopantetheine-binding protein [Coriobacteriaceae bacterium]